MTGRQMPASVSLMALAVAIAVSATDRALASSTPQARGLGASAANPVEPIVKEMKEAQSRLKTGDTGAQTRGIQEQVVRDLDKLIDAASKQQDSSHGARKSSSESKSQKQSENGMPQPGQASQQNTGEAAGTTGGSAPGRRGGTRTPRAVATKSGLAGHGPLLREVWGHLPPAMRERVRVDFSETVLPAYDELVRRYFEALLEESPQRTGAPAKSAPQADK